MQFPLIMHSPLIMQSALIMSVPSIMHCPMDPPRVEPSPLAAVTADDQGCDERNDGQASGRSVDWALDPC
jgi:hypothetical protein